MPDGDNLTGRLAQLRNRYPDAQPEMVAEVVRAVLATLSGDLTVRETSLLAEVEELGRTIAAAKAEIAALNVDDISASHIPSATDELDAIVAHTAAATDSILAICEPLGRGGAEQISRMESVAAAVWATIASSSSVADGMWLAL